MLEALWGTTWYRWTGRSLGLIAFAVAWALCIYLYGFFGFAAGWIPATVLGSVLARAWLPVVALSIVLGGGAYLLWRDEPEAEFTETTTTTTEATPEGAE